MTNFIENDIEEELRGPLDGLSMLREFCDRAGIQIDNTDNTGVIEPKTQTLEDRLIELMLKKQPAKPTVRELPPEARAEYMREAKRKSRAAAKARKAAGSLDASADNIRDVLADAAIGILAASGEGTEMVRKALTAAFPGKPGVWLSVEAEARNGKLAPKHVKLK